MNSNAAIGINSGHLTRYWANGYDDERMNCRLGCGACCIAPSISSAIPGMPNGKAAGQRCIQLDDNNLCLLFGKPERPKVCADFGAEEWVCGSSNDEAMLILTDLEKNTH